MLSLPVLDVKMSSDISQIKEHVVDLLLRGPVEITFTKADGSTRVMPCTLKEGLVPIYENKTERHRKPNAEVQSVWCLDKKEWRSFRWDRFVSIKVVEDGQN